MRFKTIWSIPAMTFGERIRRTRDWAAQKVAHALPLRIRYWATIQMVSKASIQSSNVPATPLSEVLNNLEAPKSLA